jgi:hypothetical protein
VGKRSFPLELIGGGACDPKDNLVMAEFFLKPMILCNFENVVSIVWLWRKNGKSLKSRSGGSKVVLSPNILIACNSKRNSKISLSLSLNTPKWI